MKINDIIPGQVVKFIVQVDHSNKNQTIQEVVLRVTDIDQTYISGINVNRILDGSQDTLPYRTYKIEKIINDTVWLKLDS